MGRLFVFLVTGFLLSSFSTIEVLAADSGCCGSSIVVFHPPVPQVQLLDSVQGIESIIICQGGGSPGIHSCICITGQQEKSCRYTIEFGGGGVELVQGGGCIWRNMDGRLWCMDRTCGNTGEEDIPVAPIQ